MPRDIDELETSPTGEVELTVGTEVEAPESPTGEMTLTRHGKYSGNLRGLLAEMHGGYELGDGYIGSDPTAGVEVRSNPMSPVELSEWYRDIISDIREVASFEPTGFAGPDQNAASFGLHIHVSSLDEEDARALYELSRKPWFQPFVCTSITNRETAQVFRNRYCHMTFRSSPTSSNNCVRLVEEHNGHWEWRMPEPMLPENFDLVMRFMEILKSEGGAAAGEYAKAFIDNADERLTSIKRAKACGLVTMFDESERIIIDRTPVRDDEESHSFFMESRGEAHRPYIYRVQKGDDTFYAFWSDNYDPSEEFEDNGITYYARSVIDAYELSRVDEDIEGEILDAVEKKRNDLDHSNSPNKSDATEELISVLKGPSTDDESSTDGAVGAVSE